jgi:hypothetical protein
VQADVIPSLAAVTGLGVQEVAAAWEKARASAMRQNHGYDDSRTYVLTLENFRQANPFSYAALGAEVRQPPKRAASAASTQAT